MYYQLKSKEEYIEYLVQKYADMVYRLAMSRVRNTHEANDVFQEVFLRLSKKLPDFFSDEHEKAWLIRVTINCSKKILNNSFSKHVVELKEELEFNQKEENQIYYDVLKLSQKYRTVIHLFYYEDLSLKQISEVLNVNENTVKTRLSRAREKLKQISKYYID